MPQLPTGDLCFADRDNHRVRKLDRATGSVSTAAGTGTAGFGGDNGAARDAKAYDVAVASDGTIYVTDGGNHRIRRIAYASGSWIITTIAGTGTVGGTASKAS